MISREEIWQNVGQIAVTYQLYKCDICAIAIMNWLDRMEVEGTVLLLRTASRRDAFITSKRYGLNESITINGKHYGVEVMGKVSDNLSEEGLFYEAWLSDFNCRSGRFIVEEIPLSSLLT